jgi:hypothetical protein
MISLLFSNQLLRKIEWYPDCSGRDRNPIQKRVHFFYLIHIVVSCHQYWWICIWRTNCVTQLLVLTVRSKIDIRNCIQLILLICNLNRPLWFKTYNCANIVIVNLYQCIINHIFCAVHFWAPAFKWGISIANIADFTKPPEKISYPQQIGMHMHIELHVVLSIADFSLSYRCTCALLFNFHTCENVYFWNLCKEQTCASEWIYGMMSTRVATRF